MRKIKFKKLEKIVHEYYPTQVILDESDLTNDPIVKNFIIEAMKDAEKKLDLEFEKIYLDGQKP
jgi:hypothetical protein